MFISNISDVLIVSKCSINSKFWNDFFFPSKFSGNYPNMWRAVQRWYFYKPFIHFRDTTILPQFSSSLPKDIIANQNFVTSRKKNTIGFGIYYCTRILYEIRWLEIFSLICNLWHFWMFSKSNHSFFYHSIKIRNKVLIWRLKILFLVLKSIDNINSKTATLKTVTTLVYRDLYMELL